MSIAAMSTPRTGPGQPRADQNPKTRLRDSRWYFEAASGATPEQIAAAEDVHPKTVRSGIARAAARIRELVAAGRLPGLKD